MSSSSLMADLVLREVLPIPHGPAPLLSEARSPVPQPICQRGGGLWSWSYLMAVFFLAALLVFLPGGGVTAGKAPSIHRRPSAVTAAGAGAGQTASLSWPRPSAPPRLTICRHGRLGGARGGEMR